MAAPAFQTQPAVQELPTEVQSGLNQLLRAYDYARELECSLWDFSVEMERLLALGVTTSDLRWLAKRDYVRHAQEVTRSERTRNVGSTCKREILLFPAVRALS